MPALSPSMPHPGELARKYCGGGWGGYALYIFDAREARDAFVASSVSALPPLPMPLADQVGGAGEGSGGAIQQNTSEAGSLRDCPLSLRIAIEPYVRPVH